MSDGAAETLATTIADRRRCFRAVADDPTSKHGLVEELDVSRSTVDRAVRDLETAGLVTYDDGEYRTTLVGACALRAHENYRERLASIAHAEDVIEALPRDTPLGIEFVGGAEVYASRPRMPDDVLDHLFESVHDAQVVEGVAPVALTGHLDDFGERARAGDAEIHLLVERCLLDDLRAERDVRFDEEYPEGEVTVEGASVPFDFGLWIADDAEAGVVVYTDTGVRGILVNDTPGALAWARERFERARATVD